MLAIGFVQLRIKIISSISSVLCSSFHAVPRFYWKLLKLSNISIWEQSNYVKQFLLFFHEFDVLFLVIRNRFTRQATYYSILFYFSSINLTSVIYSMCAVLDYSHLVCLNLFIHTFHLSNAAEIYIYDTIFVHIIVSLSLSF